MTKTKLILFFFLLIFSASKAQVNDLKIGYEEFPTTISGHASDSSGNMYYSGYFKGQLKVNNQVLENGAGQEDISIFRLLMAKAQNEDLY